MHNGARAPVHAEHYQLLAQQNRDRYRMQRNFVLKVALVLLCTVAVLERWQDRNEEGLLGKPRNPGGTE